MFVPGCSLYLLFYFILTNNLARELLLLTF